MEPWFFREPARLRRERERVDELARRDHWLVGHEWHFEDGELCLDAVIQAHGYDYEVRVLFPPLFPDAPAIVRPRNAKSRLSAHQYGDADGPLCLEWGPDNWHRELSAADMLESAHRLFEIENPLGAPTAQPATAAPSRHQLTPGQELRASFTRWYCSSGLTSFIAKQGPSGPGSFKFSFRTVAENEWVFLVHEAAPLEGAAWIESLTPTNLPEARATDLYSGAWFRTNASGDIIQQVDTLDKIRRLLPDDIAPSLLATDGSSPVDGMNRPIVGILVCDRDDALHALVVLWGNSTIYCARVVSDIGPGLMRAPDSERLAGMRVGIVGVGSLGSKVATALARMGAQRFFLVDYDVLLPENLARNALDWQGVARHKVDATRTALSLISPLVEVVVRRTHLTGQESNAAISGVLTKLTQCDVILDATANARVFNLLAAAARASQRPLVWVEVFGGGVGGLIARSRPGVDPSPQRMRLAYLQYCSDNPVPPSMTATQSYAIEDPAGNVLVASDADVGILANHSARLLSDCLLPPSRSQYPYSMYLIGLAGEWVFRQPLETIPIDTSTLGTDDAGDVDGGDLQSDDARFLLGILGKKSSS